jgi:flagellar biosynthesis anti-sigma factor FlgM
MKINNTTSPDALKAYNQQSLQGVHLNKDKESANALKSSTALSSDRVNISSTVKLMQDIVKAVSETPDTRADKVKEITSKIENGLYKPDLSVIADKLLSPNISDRI